MDPIHEPFAGAHSGVSVAWGQVPGSEIFFDNFPKIFPKGPPLGKFLGKLSTKISEPGTWGQAPGPPERAPANRSSIGPIRGL